MQIPKKIDERVVQENPYRQILEKDFVERDGSVGTYMTIRATGTKQATMILPVTESGEIVIQKEFRVGMEEIIYQFPVGILEPDLSAEENCKKELSEETGYTTNSLTKLGTTISEYYYDAHIHHYIAKNCIAGEQDLELSENIEALTVTQSELEDMISRWTISCPLTISCYTLAKMKGQI